MGFLGYLDYQLTRAATEIGGTSPLRAEIVNFAADLLPYFFTAAAVWIFLSGRTKRQKEKGQDAVIAALGAVLLAIGTHWLIGEVFHRDRPFVTHQINYVELVDPLEQSFPSGHAMILFAFAGTIYFIGNHRKWGVILLTVAAVVAIARVVAGVHYPSDVIAGALLGLALAKLVSWQSRWLAKEMR